jgi:pyruvate/2-oxoglutarate dehydrogenase complex dihydrolipoamide dehydrogenase (E3) component
MSEQFDAIVIGAGQSGPFLAARLAEAGQKTALIERTHLGGTCVNDGCTPTKTLVASARAAWVVRHAGEFGVTIGGPVSVDMRAVKARKDMVVNASVQSLTEWLGNTEGLELVTGSARFVSPTEVALNNRILTAPRIFINTGARPSIPDWPGLSEVPYLTNTTMMDLDTLPEHLVIAGASYIALEFAQIYARFGSRVTVIARGDRPAAREDDDISAAIRHILEQDGVQFRFNTNVQGLARHAAGLQLSLTGPAGDTTLTASHLLLALGRTPNSEDLDLPAAGLEPDKHGYVPVDDHLRTSVPGIWAMGDINGRGAFTHTSYNDFEIVADNLLDNGDRSIAGRVPVYGMFIDPPLGRIGIGEAEARALGRPVLTATMPMTKVARARERSETEGLMKVFVDAATHRILGAAILGIRGDEVVQSILQLMTGDLPYTSMQHTMPIHPTVTELLPSLLADLKPLR